MKYSAGYLAILQHDIVGVNRLLQSEEQSIVLKSLAYARLGKTTDAKGLLSIVQEDSLKGDERRYYLETQLLIALNEGNVQIFMENAHRVLEAFPDSYFANTILGFGYKMLKKWSNAYDHYQVALRDSPNNENLNMEVLGLLKKLGKRGEVHKYKKKIKRFWEKILIEIEFNLAFQILLSLCVFVGMFLFPSIFVVTLAFLAFFLLWQKSTKNYDILVSSFLFRILASSLPSLALRITQSLLAANGYHFLDFH